MQFPSNTNRKLGTEWRPVAYLTLRDASVRTRVMDVLARAGWAAIPEPTGFHLIQAISEVIEGHHRGWLRPSMIVIDAHSRGCAGTTIAAGLRDLGITIPIVLIAAPGETLPVSGDHMLRIVDAASAEAVVSELAASSYGMRASSPPEHREAG